MGLFDRLKSSLSRTRDLIVAALPISGRLDAQSKEALEAALIKADLGPTLAAELLDKAAKAGAEGAASALKQALTEMASLGANEGPPFVEAAPLAKPEVTLIVGVNGSGKTTTCGKLASACAKKGEKVMLAAADTFRAAAVKQLEIWAERSKAMFYGQGEGADPASVAFDACKLAQSKGVDRLFIDTAGRLQTKSNLMEELSKVYRVCAKALPGSPHRVLLVLDGTAGQNMVSQAKLFNEACPLSALVVTKLDGTAKAGAVLQVIRELKIGLAFIGVGEGPDDFQAFDPQAFAAALVG